MTIRVSDSQVVRNLIGSIVRNRGEINKYSDEVSTGYKVLDPSDSKQAGTIAKYQESLARVEGYKNRIASVQSQLNFQDDILVQVNDLLLRAKEVATQGANEINGPEGRQQMAAEVWEMRDHLVQLANSTFKGRYLFGGADDDDPPYDQASNYTNPATGSAALRYAFDAEAGTSAVRNVQISDDLSIAVNTPGNQLFNNALYALERLGRALEGYDTQPATGAPSGAGNAYTFPTDFGTQTQAIQNAIDLLDTARTDDIMPERVSLGGRMRRLETATALIDLTKYNATEALATLQDADVAESATKLSQAQNALQASMAVSLRVINTTILDYI